jgi:hypothetical protein
MMIICIIGVEMGDPQRASLPRSTRVEQCPFLQTNVHWPVPVDQRLNELLGQLADLGSGEITRSQLLAALVATAPIEAARLEKLLRRYRNLTAGAIVLQRKGSIEIPVRRPGRRPRAG